MYKSLLHLFIIINILIYLFILLSGFKSLEFNKYNIYFIIPFIYLIYILPFNPLLSCQQYFARLCIDNYPEDNKKSISDVIESNSNFYILPSIHNNIYSLYPNHTFNPVSYQGLLLFAYIVNIYILKYQWNEL
jgi:hypothetical protein